MSNTSKKVEELQDQLKVLKSEIKETLVDIRELLLTNAENPFAWTPPAAGGSGPGYSPPVPGYGGGTFVAVGNKGPVTPRAPKPPGQDAESSAKEEDEDEEEPDEREEPEVSDDEDDEDDAQEDEMNEPETWQPAQANGHDAAGVRGAVEAGEPGPGPMPGPAAGWAAPEPAARPQRPAPAMESAPGAEPAGSLLGVAVLSPWIEKHLARLGSERLGALLDIYAAMGGMPAGLHQTVRRLVSLDGTPAPDGAVPFHTYLQALGELDSLMYRSRNDRLGAALMAMMLTDGQGPPGAREG